MRDELATSSAWSRASFSSRKLLLSRRALVSLFHSMSPNHVRNQHLRFTSTWQSLRKQRLTWDVRREYYAVVTSKIPCYRLPCCPGHLPPTAAGHAGSAAERHRRTIRVGGTGGVSGVSRAGHGERRREVARFPRAAIWARLAAIGSACACTLAEWCAYEWAHVTDRV